MDTLLRNARILGRDYTATFDIGIAAGRIAAIEPVGAMSATAAAKAIDAARPACSQPRTNESAYVDVCARECERARVRVCEWVCVCVWVHTRAHACVGCLGSSHRMSAGFWFTATGYLPREQGK